MRLTVIGWSGSVPGPLSPASCYLVELDGFRLVLDLGNGALGPLQAHLAVDRIDAIVLSHLHPDHCIDMTSLSVLLRYGPARPAAPIPVWGPAETAQRLASAYDPRADPSMFDALFSFHEAVARQPVRMGPFEVEFARMNHPVPTVAVRLTGGGRTLVYSGDTGECSALVELARGADALLCEAAWGATPDEVPNLHLTAAQAGRHAASAGVARLLLTHIPPWISLPDAMTDAASTFRGDLIAVSAGHRYTI